MLPEGACGRPTQVMCMVSANSLLGQQGCTHQHPDSSSTRWPDHPPSGTMNQGTAPFQLLMRPVARSDGAGSLCVPPDCNLPANIWADIGRCTAFRFRRCMLEPMTLKLARTAVQVLQISSKSSPACPGIKVPDAVSRRIRRAGKGKSMDGCCRSAPEDSRRAPPAARLTASAPQTPPWHQ